MKMMRSLFFLVWIPVTSLAVFGGSVACGPGGPPEPPSDMTTDTNLNVDGQVVITWTLKEELKDRVSKFRIYRDDKSDGDYKSMIKEINQSEGTLDKDKKIYAYKFTDTNVIVGSQYEVPYYYRITAVGQDAKEGVPSKTLTAKTANFNPPEVVQGVTVSGGNIYDDIEQRPDPKVVITWKSNVEHDVEGYYVFRSSTDAPISTSDVAQAHSKIISHKPGQAEFSWADQLKTEEIGKPYWYSVVAVDKGNQVGRNQPKNRYLGLALKTAELQNPQKGSSTAKPVFKWSAVDSALAYVVVVQKSTRGDEVWRSPVLDKNKTEVTMPDSPSLTTGLKYYWYVTAYAETPSSNEKNGNSTSPLWNFTASADD